MSAKPIPEGYHTVTPYIIVKNGADAIDFYTKAFGATEVMRLAGPDGKVMHAEIKVGDSHIMLAEGCPEMGFKDPSTYGGTPVSLVLYVPDVDACYAKAVASGATANRPVVDQFYGDRSGTLTDPFGHVWTVSTHIEDLTAEQIGQRAEEWMKKAG